ncbi:tetratricopeptide repeat protein [Pseudoroseicyclus aestuarii]|uniref:Tetratricopeptide repeat protein n=1 Tax=Pseudoroseicyclus aestuarii TaxID=1795041 RepID=A0A318SNN1_9RHOB|nr:tetratricopeptide repeat protein [Pseudoroseicyclus aestuarii]PYE82215.1 tetratricopeptide repeat protein [Pseudoroseicyclus aestuarii]
MTRLPLAAALVAVLLISGCKSSEERAEEYYQSALALMEEGDVDRALVELRNVFDNDGFHRDARRLYADTMRERGNLQEAYSQYLRLVEQYPDDLETRLTLAEMAVPTADWDEVRRHGEAAIAIDADLPRSRAIAAALAYREASMAQDDAAREEAAEEARAVLEVQPENAVARRIIIDALMNGPDPQAALPELARAIEADPAQLELQLLRFRLLVGAEREEEAEAEIETMAERFPDNEQVRKLLIAWYMDRGDLEQAEALLRELAGPADAPVEGHVTLVQFLEQARGSEAARAELSALIEANQALEGPEAATRAALYRSLRAGIDFSGGARAEAISEMQDIVEGGQPSDQRRRAQVTLARMLIATGNAVGARAQVEEVLEEDPSNTEALKLRANWAIEEDRPGDAISDLRSALGQSPRDPEIMTLMAEAHERDGSLELAGERLALAVEVSGNAPEESLRYATFLQQQDRLQAADSVLEDARRVSPGNLPLLQLSAQRALQRQDWAALGRMIETLETLSSPEAQDLAEELRTARSLGQRGAEATVAALEAQIGAGADADGRAAAMLALARFRAGDAEGARAAVDTALEARPEDAEMRILSANLYIATEDPGAAEAELRRVLEEAPGQEGAVTRLFGLLEAQGQGQEAAAVLARALEAAPESRQLRALEAGRLEAAGDIEGSLEIYEALYAEDSGNLVVANNLASLIGTHIEDPQALERAATIARRLRGRDQPAFQDTYGWIEYRRGNIEEAVTQLEPAARGLPRDPLVRYHLGMAYAAAGQEAEAREALEAALEMAGDSPLPQFQIARETLDGLGEAGTGTEGAAETGDQTGGETGAGEAGDSAAPGSD